MEDDRPKGGRKMRKTMLLAAMLVLTVLMMAPPPLWQMTATPPSVHLTLCPGSPDPLSSDKDSG
jgi:hypothetical protein